jgi:hypothetical protein
VRRHQVAVSAFSALVALLLGACKSKDNTELVVTVWSDFSVPNEMDAIRIQVAGQKQSIDRNFSKSGGRVEFLTKEGGGAWWCGTRDDAAANAQLAATGGTTSVG